MADLGIAVVLILAIGLPFNDAISNAPYQARNVTCKSNLRQIGIAIMSYQANHQGQMPSGLRPLIPILRSPAVFECPLLGYGPAPDYAHQSYTYRFLRQPRGDDIICWDSGPHRPEHSIFVWLNRDSWNVLYANGSVGIITEERFAMLSLRGASLTFRQ